MKNSALASLITFSCFVFGMERHEQITYWHIPKETCEMIARYASSSGIKTFQAQPYEGYKLYRSRWAGVQIHNDEIVKIGTRYEYKEPQFGFKQLSLEDGYSVASEYDFVYSNMVLDRRLDPRVTGQNYTELASDRANPARCLSPYFRLRCHYKVLRHEKAKCLAVSKKNLVALHTRYHEDKSDLLISRLRLFSYILRSHEQQEENGLPQCKLTPINLGDTKLIPEFKKIAWIYGKALLALLDGGSLYMIDISNTSNQSSRFESFIQKNTFWVDNFAVHQPVENHEIILVNSKGVLYFAALNDRTVDKKIRYRKIWDNPGHFTIKDLWFYNDTICMVNSKRECLLMRLGDKKEYVPSVIHQKLLPLYKMVAQKKNVVCNQNGLLFEDYEPTSL